MWIDLNADVGEGFEAADRAIMPLVSSANIACGGHAGDLSSMRTTVELAQRHRVRIGAHPGYPDRVGFGRRALELPERDLRASLRAQLDALSSVVAEAGARLEHVKPHGALYHRAATDRSYADLVADVVRAWDAEVTLVGPPDSRLVQAGRAAGLTVVAEGFADRAYEANGGLRPRAKPGAMLEEPATAAAQALAIARDARVLLDGGGFISLVVDTICIHGDTPGAADRLRAVRAALVDAGIGIKAPTSAR